MNRDSRKFSVLFVSAVLFVAGCATVPRPSRTPAESPLQAPPSDLQNQLQAKDAQIQDLQSQLDSSQHSLINNFSAKSGPGKSSSIRVKGVTAMDVQKALKRAGFDPGPADDRFGKKTKKAIKAFQRKNGLHADGIVGEKTWALLNRS